MTSAGSRPSKASPSQPLSAGTYARIAIPVGVFCLGTACLYVFLIPRLTQFGIENQVFYLVLLLWGVFCAIILSGVMRTYARATEKKLGSTLEFGGPAAIAFLVVVGGFMLVPRAREVFDLTVRPHGANGTSPVITSGKVTIDLDNDRRTNPIGSNGEADFKGVPAKFRGAIVGVLPQVEGYKQDWQRVQLKGAVLDLALEQAPQPVTRLTGSIVPPPEDWAKLRITVDGQPGEAKVDELGRFDFQVTGKDGDTVRLKIYDATRLVYDNFETLPGPLSLALNTK